jgi:hypothetical protein
MIHLLPNTPNQTAFFSPFQARKFLASFTNYLIIFTNTATEETHACILFVSVDNARYTTVRIWTDEDTPVDGKVLIKESGLYTYKIYGQNSTTNVDPTNAAVVGLCESGMMRATASEAWDTPAITIPDNVIYYE